MCGIGGKLSFDGSLDPALGERMTDYMAHRGPNDKGVYAAGPVVLAHRRLSILDLSDAGHQPMANEDGTVHIVFNGEIYNYRELRERTTGHTYRSETDTEVILHLYEEEGTDCLSLLRGMFAFAIWDERTDRLFLARDRLGQKPLYYAADDSGLVFGSTIRSVLADEAVDAEPDPEAVRAFLTYQYVPHPRTGFQGIRRLGPAESLVVSGDDLTRETYWGLSYADQFDGPPRRIADRLTEKVREATRLRMRSDVPVGVFLSGGVDSTIVTALMAGMADEPVRTYSIGFDEYDELEYARSVADEYGTDHHEHTVTPDALSVLPELVEEFEMPFGDPSAVPTHYVSKVAADDLRVAVGGDGGDELFAGYDRYTFDRVVSLLSRIPDPVRAAGAKTLGAVDDGGLTSRLRRPRRALELAGLDPIDRYARFVCHILGEDARRLWTGLEPDDEIAALRTAFERANGPHRLDRLMHVDIRTYLPDDLLVKVDRASMAHSLEVRSPFLDHELAAFAARIPAKYKWRRGTKKWILKRAFADLFPERVKGRSKQGFSVPVDAWFRGELRPHATDALDRLGDRPLFDGDALDALLRAHVDGRADNGHALWDLVVLAQWYETFFAE